MRPGPATPARLRKRARGVQHNDRLRLAALEAVAQGTPACLSCGETDLDVLAIDHVYDDGSQDRALGWTGPKWHRAIRDGRVDRSRLQVLCANCNTKKQRIRERALRTGLDTTRASVLY